MRLAGLLLQFLPSDLAPVAGRQCGSQQSGGTRMHTHEAYIHAVAGLAIARLENPADQARLNNAKLVYGAGNAGLRGVTYYEAWQNGSEQAEPFIEVCAMGESSHTQVAGTTIHELAHVLAGYEAGHGKDWKAACKLLGLRFCRAAGQSYHMAAFSPDIRAAIVAMTVPSDGAPSRSVILRGKMVARPKPKPCSMGIGTRGGKSRGAGSGSRLLKIECESCGYVARVSAKWIDDPGPPHCPNHGAMVVAN